MSEIYYTEEDILLILQSIAQSLRAYPTQSDVDAPLFITLKDVSTFSGEQIQQLAEKALLFFDFDGSAEFDSLHAHLLTLTKLRDWGTTIFQAWKGTALCFQTSGSTGKATLHRYTLPVMLEEEASLAPHFASRQRIVSVMPTHHIFGHMHSLLLGKTLGIPVVYAPPLPLRSFLELLQEGDAVIAFPFFWQSLLPLVATYASRNLHIPPQVVGVTAGAPCPAGLIQDLIIPRAGDSSPILATMQEIYGSTETNGIGIRYDGAKWYELYAHWDTERDADGVRCMRRKSGGDLVSLPDVVTWQGDRHLRPERRADKAVQVAGMNVYPEKIAAKLKEHALVKDCAVRLMRPEEGARLKAFIVPRGLVEEAPKQFGREFRAWIFANLPTPARPKHFRFGEQLPLSEMGKLKDWDCI